MEPIVPTGKGEVLRLGPPVSAEVILVVDAQQHGGPFSMGTLALQPGGSLPMHRHLERDEVWFIHRGQGRATVGTESATVVPGAVIAAPRQVWQALRNTGTGVLHCVWMASPAGLESFFRELAQQRGPLPLSTLQAIAGRHGIEVQGEGGTAGPAASPLRRRRRGGRGRGRQRATPARTPQPPAPLPPAPPPKPAVPPSAPVHPAPSRGGVKEVYMSGRWVPVTGEGPVIAPGPEHRRRHRTGQPRGGGRRS